MPSVVDNGGAQSSSSGGATVGVSSNAVGVSVGVRTSACEAQPTSSRRRYGGDGLEEPSMSEGIAIWREMERARKKARRGRMHVHAN